MKASRVAMKNAVATDPPGFLWPAPISTMAPRWPTSWPPNAPKRNGATTPPACLAGEPPPLRRDYPRSGAGRGERRRARLLRPGAVPHTRLVLLFDIDDPRRRWRGSPGPFLPAQIEPAFGCSACGGESPSDVQVLTSTADQYAQGFVRSWRATAPPCRRSSGSSRRWP